MPRIIQDMVKKKTIRREIKVERPTTPAPVVRKRTRILMSSEKQTRNPKYRVWVVALLATLSLLFALSLIFSKAYITVNPKYQEVVLNEKINASKDTNGSLSFDLVVISGEEKKNVSAGLEREVAEKAMGSVVIYNTFSSASQVLDIDTRLEGSNGKIYKTNKRIVVPGMAGGNPSSIEVGIYANSAGEEYNSEPLDFKIVGFKGSSKYEKFYGRSKGSITGGIKGKLPLVSDEDKQTALIELKNTLESKLLDKATGQIPNGFILFKNAVFLKTGEPVLDYSAVAEGQVPLTLKGTLYGFIFNENKLATEVAKDVVAGYDNSPVFIQNIRDLNFDLLNKETISFADVKNINFSLVGNSKIVWKFDNDKFVEDLLGKSKSEFNSISAKYQNITSSLLQLRPFWATSLPKKQNDFVVTINYPE